MGRFCYKRLLFGISSAPEIYQRKLTSLLHGLAGISVYMDDIPVHGTSMEEHDRRFSKVINIINTAGLHLNKEKCKLRQSQLHFLWHVFDAAGMHPDIAKVKAVRELPAPMDVAELRRILGMINYLGTYRLFNNTTTIEQITAI